MAEPGVEERTQQEASVSLESHSSTSTAAQDVSSGRTGSTLRRSTALLLLMGSLVLAVAGQYYFARRREYLLDGTVLYALAMLLFATVARSLESTAGRGTTSRLSDWWRALTAHWVRVMLTGLAFLLALFAARQAVAQPQPASFTPALISWLTAGVLLIAAQLPPPAAWAERLARLKLWAAAHRWELLALAGWLVLAGVLRIWHLAQIPYPFSGDEAAMGLEARAMLRGELRNPFATGWLSHPTLWFYCMSRFMTVFGSGIVGVRIMSALLGATTILTIYPLAREMCGVSVAQIAVALLAAYPLHIHFSRQGLSASADIWFTPLVLYFFDRGLRRNSYLCMAVSGVALGLMQYGYMTARIVPVIIIAYALYFLLTERGFLHKHGRGLLLFALCALIVWMPMGTWYLRHRSEFTARLGFSSILQPGWLQNEQLRTSRTALQILWDQTQRSFLALNYYQDTSPFYHAPAPLMSFLPSIFFIFGVAYALVHWRRRYFTLLLLWLGLVLFFGGVLTHSPPYVARLIAMIPAVCVLAALGLWKVVHFFGSLARYPKVRTGAIAAVMVGVMMLADVNWYFREYIPKPYFLDLNTEIGNILGHYLADVSPDYQVFFFGAPRMYISYSGIEFLAGRRVGADVVQPLPPGQRPAMVRGERRLIFIFLPERLGEMQAVRQFFPNGQELHFDGRFGKDIVIIYRVD